MRKSFIVGSVIVLAISFVLGCSQQSNKSDSKVSTSESEASGSKHSHGSGPHGGTIADWGGGQFHVEFTVDHDKKEATVFVLGDDAATPSPIKAEKLLLSINDPQFQVELVSSPVNGESKGVSSRFVGQDEKLGKVQEFAGTISGEVDGKPYAGDFKEEAHGHSHE